MITRRDPLPCTTGNLSLLECLYPVVRHPNGTALSPLSSRDNPQRRSWTGRLIPSSPSRLHRLGRRGVARLLSPYCRGRSRLHVQPWSGYNHGEGGDTVEELMYLANRRAVTRRRSGRWDLSMPKALADAYLQPGCQIEWRPVSATELRAVVIPPGVGPKRTRAPSRKRTA